MEARNAHSQRFSPSVRYPVSSLLMTGSCGSCSSSSAPGSATATPTSSQLLWTLPKLRWIPGTCSSKASPPRRGIRQTTVRYAISAARFGPKSPPHFRRKRGLRFLTAFGTTAPVAPVFGDLRLDGRQFSHLVSQARPPPCCSVSGERLFAVDTLLGQQFHNLVDPLGRHRLPPMPGMTWLPATLPVTLLSAASTLTLLTSKAVGGGRFRRCRRVPFAQAKLPLKIGNLLFGLHQFLVALRQLLPQLLILTLQSLLFTLQPPHVRLCTGCRTSILAAGNTQISRLPGFTPERQV